MAETGRGNITRLDLCDARHRKTHSFASPVWEVLVGNYGNTPKSFHIHEDALLKSPYYLKRMNQTSETRTKHSFREFKDVEVFVMTIDYLYTGQYSPSIPEIQRLNSEAQDKEAKHQHSLYVYAEEHGFEQLMHQAVQKLDACLISPSTFIKIYLSCMEDDESSESGALLRKWCIKWVTEHRTELLASQAFEEVIETGGDMAVTLVKDLASSIGVPERQNSLKREAEDMDNGFTSKMRKVNQPAVIDVSR
ncbi:Snf2 family helicase ATPase [Neofusicoccum parvum]|nr:Snf2 family helicase ATPase [Neofusicoccum parvum]